MSSLTNIMNTKILKTIQLRVRILNKKYGRLKMNYTIKEVFVILFNLNLHFLQTKDEEYSSQKYVEKDNVNIIHFIYIFNFRINNKKNKMQIINLKSNQISNINKKVKKRIKSKNLNKYKISNLKRKYMLQRKEKFKIMKLSNK